jgi:hypothetical protein
VLKAGWHCGGDPAANGTVADCPTCQSCKANKCQPDDTNKPKEKCATCKSGKPVPPKTNDQCCSEAAAANPSSTAGGYVVCCNGSKVACVNSGMFPPGDAGERIVRKCVFVHETAHFADVDCPTGSKECDTTQPRFKNPANARQAECDATKPQVACFLAENCKGDKTCEAKVAQGIKDAKNYGNANVPGCWP